MRSSEANVLPFKEFSRSERDGSLVQGLGYTVDVITHPNVATIFPE